MSSTKLNPAAISAKDRLATVDKKTLNANEKKMAQKAEIASRQPYSYERKVLNTISAHDIAKTKLRNQRKYDLKQQITFCTDPLQKSKLEAELLNL